MLVDLVATDSTVFSLVRELTLLTNQEAPISISAGSANMDDNIQFRPDRAEFSAIYVAYIDYSWSHFKAGGNYVR